MGSRAELLRRGLGDGFWDGSGLSQRLTKSIIEKQRRRCNLQTGGRKVRMAERRRHKRQEEINDARLARLARLEEAIEYLKRCDWRNDDAVEYARSARQRLNGIGSVGGENVTVDNLVLKKYNGSDL